MGDRSRLLGFNGVQPIDDRSQLRSESPRLLLHLKRVAPSPLSGRSLIRGGKRRARCRGRHAVPWGGHKNLASRRKPHGKSSLKEEELRNVRVRTRAAPAPPHIHSGEMCGRQRLYKICGENSTLESVDTGAYRMMGTRGTRGVIPNLTSKATGRCLLGPFRAGYCRRKICFRYFI